MTNTTFWLETLHLNLLTLRLFTMYRFPIFQLKKSPTSFILKHHTSKEKSKFISWQSLCLINEIDLKAKPRYIFQVHSTKLMMMAAMKQIAEFCNLPTIYQMEKLLKILFLSWVAYLETSPVLNQKIAFFWIFIFINSLILSS